MVNSALKTHPPPQTNFTLDLIENTDVFKASIVLPGPLHPPATPTNASSSPRNHIRRPTEPISTQTSQSAPEQVVVENITDHDAALALMFPTIFAPASSIRRTFKRLHILRGLGEGTMGRVFLARDSSTSKVFALKVFDKQDVMDSQELENTLKERDYLSEIRGNQLIINLHASFQDETRLYMQLDFCAGGDLAMEMMRWSGKMPIETAVYNAAHLLEGIASLHALGIIHRDLKPGNILLTVHGHIKISDFGSATHINLPEQWIELAPMENFGTAAYLSPEVIAGEPYNSGVDLWSLGVIIYEMVVGEHPFLPGPMDDEDASVDIEDMQESICNGEYTLPESMDYATRRIIRGLLRVDPERRYTATRARKSEFFDGWDWDLVRTLKYQAPTPRIVHDYGATSNFDPVCADMSFDAEDESAVYDPLLFRGFEQVPTFRRAKSCGAVKPPAAAKIAGSPSHRDGDGAGEHFQNRVAQLSAALAEKLSIVHGSRDTSRPAYPVFASSARPKGAAFS